MFKFIGKRRAEKLRLKKFKESIKGLFNEWEVTDCTAKSGKYKIWIYGGCSGLKDYDGAPFLRCFTPEEKKILWEEFENRGIDKEKEKVLKDFNINAEG